MKDWSTWKPWLIVIGIGLVAAAGVALSRGVFTAGDRAEILGGLCDAFFVPGALLTGCGLLALCAKEGIYDFFSYGARTLKEMFLPFSRPEKPENYYEYKMAKEQKRRKVKPYLLVVGLGFLAGAVLCLILYNGAAG